MLISTKNQSLQSDQETQLVSVLIQSVKQTEALTVSGERFDRCLLTK